MKYMELIAPCHFGMEAVLKREILDLGYEISKVEDGKAVSYTHLISASKNRRRIDKSSKSQNNGMEELL